MKLSKAETNFLYANKHLIPVKRLFKNAVLIRETDLKDEFGDYIHYVLVDGWKVQGINHYFTNRFFGID